MPDVSIHNFYEQLLEEASFDLHERYSQLLTGLKWKMDEEDALLISYIIEDMRERSSYYSPVSLRKLGVYRAWRTYANQLGKRHGIRILFEETACHVWNEDNPIIFRFLQKLIQIVVSEGGTEEIRVFVEGNSLLLLYEKELYRSMKEDFLKKFAVFAGVEVSVQEKESTVAWVVKREEGPHDFNTNCG
ncbi:MULTISPECIES: hypothetical protein [Salimicrobium]|uniref:Histidine kinase dimerization domain n=3 Tax=Salimicrobium TaxID=351195 RepID=K2GNV2_9BACI|nr:MULTISPECIES: hypothetical protein [Salimicrobium]AKG03572.1 hypothetical protein AAV35_001410 [Salimicrobium jeotgali]EKE32064.1 histidine kinase dimerization domain [Salimicrobium jeotgali]MBM7696032.1 two-component system sensor histidine kinase NreB [Salimicrobium jeotgali]SDX85446.1 two-component system, NarL family, sensor histidine kinase NreB [Salimicrobium album]SIS87430.1 two-component system, NarL family, sensor histidine kinase NreB [Salimicrobium salexigens]